MATAARFVELNDLESKAANEIEEYEERIGISECGNMSASLDEDSHHHASNVLLGNGTSSSRNWSSELEKGR